jgi:hypothetical protein
MTIYRFVIPFLIILCLGSSFVHAQERSYLRFVGLNAEYSDLHFVELDGQGEPLLEETGGMMFTGAGFYWQLKSGLFAELSYQEASETLDYQGWSQQGRFVETQTEVYVQNTNFLLGRNFGYTSAFLGIGSYFRERNILGVGEEVRGLYEELEQTNAMFGMRGNLFPQKRFQIRLEARLWTDIDSSFYASSTESDAASLTPGKSFSYRTSAEFFFDLAGGLAFSLIPAYEYTHIDKSREYPLYRNGNPLYVNSHQPETEWESYSLTGKLSWHF